jgi:ATP-dependent Lon protease
MMTAQFLNDDKSSPLKRKDEKPMNKNIEEKEPEFAIPARLGILPIRDTVIYPYMVSPLVIAREKSVRLIDDALSRNRIIGIVSQKKAEIDSPTTQDLYQFGVAATILKMLKFPDGTMRLLVQGLARIRIKEWLDTDPYFQATAEVVKEQFEKTVEVEALSRNLLDIFNRIVNMAPHLPDELHVAAMNLQDPSKMTDLIAANINLPVADKQMILETVDVSERMKKLMVLLNRELEVLEIGSKIQSQVKNEIDKNQREYVLREQMKAIQRELGETDDRMQEVSELEKKIKEAKMPEAVEKEALKELNRLAKMPPAAAEYTVSRTYLDYLIALPWTQTTVDNLDIKKAAKILDEDHYDLIKIKERILEYLSVRKLKADMKGSILCFAGPPGVGKTSLGKSIARAMNRKFIRISLGGVRDEAEIRGHRRTYIGALPGRIIQGIRRVESANPVFMLDEIDKLGADFRGDPASALLEVLDPEQNSTFSDHYLDVPFDLSKVMFITTANVLDTIPGPLRDRMEILHLPGYIEEEKIQIAKKYLVPKQIIDHGLTNSLINFDDSALKGIVTEYTREAGVRNLEREIGNVCRKVARRVAEGNKRKVKVTRKTLSTFLGPQKFFSEVAEKRSEVGLATGLAWTQYGGEILTIEVTKMPGSKGLTLTGQLGDVMKESAQAALSYVRSQSEKLGILEDFFSKTDLHIHVPAGAIPKDGPSAGVTMASAIASLLINRPIRKDIAMTGEITLRGKVLPVGGIKEKILAARRAGILTVILPKKNETDLQDIPPEIRKEMKFILVETADKVFENAFVPKPEPKKKKKK